MAQTTKQRTLQYRRARFQNSAATLLEPLLAAAIKKFPDASKREEALVPNGPTVRVASGAGPKQGMTVGRLIQYTKGLRQPLCEFDDKAGDYTLSTAVATAGQEKRRREFVESIVYFAVQGRHVMFVGGTPAASKSLESHLNWLLEQSGGIVAGKDFVSLDDQAGKEAVNKLKLLKPHAVHIGQALEFEAQQKKTGGGESGEKTSIKVLPAGTVSDVMKEFFGDWFGTQALELPSDHHERVEMTLTLKYVSHTKSDAGFELMQRIASAARHFDEEDFAVDLYKGGRLKGKELRVSGPIQVNYLEESGLVVEPDLWLTMRHWLADQIGQKVISPL